MNSLILWGRKPHSEEYPGLKFISLSTLIELSCFSAVKRSGSLPDKVASCSSCSITFLQWCQCQCHISEVIHPQAAQQTQHDFISFLTSVRTHFTSLRHFPLSNFYFLFLSQFTKWRAVTTSPGCLELWVQTDPSPHQRLILVWIKTYPRPDNKPVPVQIKDWPKSR